LKEWKTRMQSEHDNSLTDHGKNVMKNLGTRMLERLFPLFSTFRNTQISVRVTSRDRTHQSADEFLNGILKFSSFRPNYTLAENDDYLLKYPDTCEKYIQVF
jgi:hypothetical protein